MWEGKVLRSGILYALSNSTLLKDFKVIFIFIHPDTGLLRLQGSLHLKLVKCVSQSKLFLIQDSPTSLV